jgi:hypothetical protein
MLFAQLDKNEWPLKWNELEFLAKRLRSMDYSYDVIAERCVFGAYERYQFVLIKWHPREIVNNNVTTATAKREELGTYKTMEEIIPIVKLLISTEEDKLRELANGIIR